jgi:hypothetical protein
MVDVQGQTTDQPIRALDVQLPPPQRFQRRSVRVIDRVPTGPVTFAKLEVLPSISCETLHSIKEQSCPKIPSGPDETNHDDRNAQQYTTKDAFSTI